MGRAFSREPLRLILFCVQPSSVVQIAFKATGTNEHFQNKRQTMGLSSSKRKSAISGADRNMLALKTQRKKLVDQQRLLEARIDRHTEVARALVREKKGDKALFVLRKKRLVEKQNQTLSGLLINVESLVSSVETQQQQNKVFYALQEGNAALKAMQQAVSVDDVQRVLEDAADAKAQYEEMSGLLGQSLSDVDTEQVEAELQALEDQAAAQEAERLPSVPVSKPQQQQEQQQQAEVKGGADTLPSVPTTPAPQQREQMANEEKEELHAREPMLAT